MKVIMISRDVKVLERDSAVYSRLEEYVKLFDELHIVLIRKNIFSFFKAFISAGKLARKMDREDWITSQDPFEAGIVAFVIAKIFRRKLQLQIHTDCFNPMYRRQGLLNLFHYALARMMIPFADSIRVVSENIKSSLPEIKAKVHVLPIFVDIEKIKNSTKSYDLRLKYPEFEKIIIIVARLEREKNLTLALESFQKILRKLPKTGLVVVGSGSEEPWMHKLSEHLGISENIRFEGWLANPIPSYKSSDLLLVTSFYEGYGMNIVEALASGCPVVSTDVGIAGEAGALVANYDPGEIALKSIEILEGGIKGELLPAFAGLSKQEYLGKYRQMFI